MTKYRAMIAAGAFCPEDGTKLKLTPEQSEAWLRLKRRERATDGVQAR